MTSFTPSEHQAAAIRAIKAWFETRTHEQQVFRLFGYGCGPLVGRAVAGIGAATRGRGPWAYG